MQVGHHPVLARNRDLDAREDLPRPFVAGMQHRHIVGINLGFTPETLGGLHQEIAHDHLNGVTGSSGLGNIHPS